MGANNISSSELLVVCRVDVVREEATAKTNNVGKLMDGGLDPGVPAAILVDVVKVDFIKEFKVKLDRTGSRSVGPRIELTRAGAGKPILLGV